MSKTGTQNKTTEEKTIPMSKTKQKEQPTSVKETEQAEIVIRDHKRYLRTPKGSELPLLQLKGKDYLQVAHRLVWLREEHPDWQIITKPLEINFDKKYAIFRSQIVDEQGRVRATGTKAESIQGFSDYIEKAETGATGRAAALCGYGTQFAPELDEGERLADSPVDPVRKTESVVNPATYLKKAGAFATVVKNGQETCKNCGSKHLSVGLTKADNPRNPNRPYWKCLNCPPERSFSHWVPEQAVNQAALPKAAPNSELPFES